MFHDRDSGDSAGLDEVLQTDLEITNQERSWYILKGQTNSKTAMTVFYQGVAICFRPDLNPNPSQEYAQSSALGEMQTMSQRERLDHRP